MAQLDEAFLSDAVDACLERKAAVFGGFYRPFIVDYARRLAQREADCEPEQRDCVDWRRTTGPLLDAALEEMHRTGVRSLVTTFRAQRDDPTARGYADFHAWVSGDEGRNHILESFPELDRLLHLAAARHLRNAGEVLAATVRDGTALADTLGAGGRVAALWPGLGDSHRGGRTVCIVRWENGVDTVYKPQQRSCHTLLHALQRLLDPEGAFFGPLCPQALAYDAHLWQRYIVHTDIRGHDEDSDAAAARYFRRFGRAAALLTLLGANDLHHENVIATADGPVVIDLETLVSLPERIPTGSHSALVRDTQVSPLNSLLFPVRNMDGIMDMDLSALGNVRTGESQRLQSFTVVDGGTDNIRFATTPAAVPPGGANVATIDGEQLDPRVWVDYITAGFTEARELLQNHRSAVEEIARRGDWSVRQILRPTFVYWRFLEASTHPAYLADEEDRAALFDKMPHRHRGVEPDRGEAVGRAETAALAGLDVPFFEVEADSRDLRVNGTDEGIGAAVSATPREELLARIGAFFDRPSGRDLSYIRFALMSSVDDVWEPGARRDQARATIRGALPALSDTGAWQAILADLAVTGDDGLAAWMMPRLYGPGLRLDATNTLLYEGGGLLLYLAQAAACGQNTGVDVGALFAGAASEPAAAAPFPLAASPFTGLLSTRVAGLELRLRGSGTETPLPLAALPDTSRLVAEEMSAEDFDYINGLGGYLVYLAAYADTDRHGPRPPELAAVSLLRRLVEVDGPPGEHAGEMGLAHGRFGRIAAISAQVACGTDTDGRARAHLERFATAYLRHRWRDEALRDATSDGGWCKGYAGIAYAAADMLECVGYSAAEIRRELEPEVECIISAELSPDLSLCHGAAGRVAMLCLLADRLEWPRLRDEAAQLSATFLERYDGGGWCSGIGSAPELPGFMLGTSGWHFSQLMLGDPTVRLPYCLGGR